MNKQDEFLGRAADNNASAGSLPITTARSNILEGGRLVAQGVCQDDRSLIRQAAVLFNRSIGQHDLTALASYYTGYAHYRLATIGPKKERPDGNERLAEAIAHLRKAVNYDDRDAEAQALLGLCYSVSIGRRQYRALFHGPAAAVSLRQALKEAPENPRVVLFNAFVMYMKPILFGGSERAAVQGFERAAELFDTWIPPDGPFADLQPSWGEAETYVLLGSAYARRGEQDKGKRALERALMIAPDFGRAKRQLRHLEDEGE